MNIDKIFSLGKKIIPTPLFNFFQPFYHYIIAFLGAIFYRFPSLSINVIGVTGSKGKSSVVYLLSKIFENAGIKVGASSSIYFKIGDNEIFNDKKMTMPGRFFMQKFLRQCVKKGCKYAIIEVSSEGIKQFRHKFIKFDTVVFTNLEQEHIESHGGFENYRRTKLKLFQAWGIKNSVVNIDDKNVVFFLAINTRILRFGYGLYNNALDFTGFDFKSLYKPQTIISLNPLEFILNGFYFKSFLYGEFNLYNILAALTVASLKGVPLEFCSSALLSIKGIPGRFEFIHCSQDFSVIVDYAHTPVSLEQVYKTAKNFLKNKTNKLICVLGSAGGGRDKWKRPELGKLAALYCNKIILTNEDPYDEDPLNIILDIKKGINLKNKENIEVFEIIDRKEAIRKALVMAKNGDVVIITGKGSEQWMMIAGQKKIPWSDKKIIEEYFTERQ